MDEKTALRHYLHEARQAIVWKLDGLSEAEARRPRTPTGTNLLGIVKHCLNVEAGYFGPTFGRAFPQASELVADSAFDADPQSDWYATEAETRDGLIDLYRRVWAFADHTIDELPLDAPGQVPWWGPDGRVTLHRILVHVIYDLSRHAGQADILREQHDGAIGWQPDDSNLPDGYDWPAYVAKLEAIADRFG